MANLSSQKNFKLFQEEGTDKICVYCGRSFSNAYNCSQHERDYCHKKPTNQSTNEQSKNNLEEEETSEEVDQRKDDQRARWRKSRENKQKAGHL